jgi:Bacterial Ig domain/Repeat of unknown function (DUF5648)
MHSANLLSYSFSARVRIYKSWRAYCYQATYAITVHTLLQVCLCYLGFALVVSAHSHQASIAKVAAAQMSAVVGDTTPMWRLYSPILDSFVDVPSKASYDFLISVGWEGRGIAYQAFSAPGSVDGVPTMPMYRLYSQGLGTHYYAQQKWAYDYLVSVGWKAEGIRAHILPRPTPSTVALERFYHPQKNRHYFSIDANDRGRLKTQGWQSNGIVGFVLPPDFVASTNRLPVLQLDISTSLGTTPPASFTATVTSTDAAVAARVVEYFVTRGDGTTLRLGQTTGPTHALPLIFSPVDLYEISARGSDETGKIITSNRVMLSVRPRPAAAPPNVLPQVAVTAPDNNATANINEAITLRASASDADGVITQLEFFIDSEKIGEANPAPHALMWTPSRVGTYRITVAATDDASAHVISAPILLNVKDPSVLPPKPANRAPTVGLTQPDNGALVAVGASVSIAADAADIDGGIARVVFFADGNKVGEATTPPYRATWVATAAGIRSIYAIATDNEGLTATSIYRFVTVQASPAPPPPPTATVTTVTIRATLPETRVTLQGPTPAQAGIWTSVDAGALVNIENAATPNSRAAFVAAGTYQFEFKSAAGVLLAKNTVVIANSAWIPAATSTAVDHLKNAIKPNFKLGHTLKPLGSAAIVHQPMTLIELADNWGWGLQINMNIDYCGINPAIAAGPPLYNGNHGDEVLKIALSSNSKYKLIINTSNLLPGGNVSTQQYLNDVVGGVAQRRGFTTPEEVWFNTADPPTEATRVNGRSPLFSPLAPLSWVQARGADANRCVKQVTDLYPASVLADFAEYGATVFANNYCAMVMDKKSLTAVGYPTLSGSPYAGCGTQIADSTARADRDYKLMRLHISNNISQLKALKTGVLNGLRWAGGQTFYSVYGNSYSTDRGRWAGWTSYGNYYEDEGADKLSSASSPEFYYARFNSGFTGINATGTPSDIVTGMLNNVGGTLKNGVSTFYPWISSGWGANEYVASRDRWMGFLKLMYATGAVGALSGYFDYTDEFVRQAVSGAPVGTASPVWLSQYTDIAHVHALFSHLETFVKQSDLVQGATHQGYDTHPYNEDRINSPAVPYYALRLRNEWRDEAPNTVSQGGASPTGGPQAYVIARKLRGQNQWLFTAWANQGNDRDVVATLPGQGDITLRARVPGSVYIATKQTNGSFTLQLMDRDAMQPSLLLF